MSKAYVETIGVIENEVIVNDISDVVEKLLSKKPNEVNSDTTELESQIDKLIYKLYDLTEEEIKIVEGEK